MRGRKVVSAGEQRPPRLLRAPAPGVHVGGALGAQSRAGDGVGDIVDAGVPGHAAAEHGRIGGVDDGAGAQRGEVAPPQGDPLPQRPARAAGARQGRQLERVGGAGGAHALSRLGGEQGVEVLAGVVVADRPGRADGEQAVEEAALLNGGQPGQHGGRREGGDVARPDGLGREVLRQARQARQARDVNEGAGAVRHAPRLSPPPWPHGRRLPVPRAVAGRASATPFHPRLRPFSRAVSLSHRECEVRIDNVGRVGPLGRSGAGTCPNLLQRRSATGSAAKKSAEYQRFSSGTPARSGPLQQIWTTCRRGPSGEGGRGSDGDHDGRPDDRTRPAGRPPGPRDRHLTREHVT